MMPTTDIGRHALMRKAGGVDLDDANDEIEELEFSLSGEARIAAFRARADSLAPGEDGRAEFLTSLGEFLEMEGRLDEADAVYREALDDGGPTLLHPLGGMLSLALVRGDSASIHDLNTRLWSLARANVLTVSDYEHVADLLEHHEHLREAMRWYTVLLSDFDPDEIDLIPVVASNGRFRVRRALGLPLDRYDESAPAVREHAKAQWK